MPSWSVVLAALAAFGLQVIPARDAGPSGQAGASIKGRVVDAATKAPLSGARVRLSGSSQRGPVLTDDAGAFVFTGLPGGTYSNGGVWKNSASSGRWSRVVAKRRGIQLASQLVRAPLIRTSRPSGNSYDPLRPRQQSATME
jgi:hypothetical protein